MTLEEFPTIEELTSSEEYTTLAPEEQASFLDYTRRQALEAARHDPDINSPSEPPSYDDGTPSQAGMITPSQNYESFEKYINEGVNKSKNDITTKQLGVLLEGSFPDVADRNRAIDQINQHKNDYSMMDEDVAVVARKANDIWENSGVSGVSHLPGSLKDSRDNDLAQFNISFNSKKNPEYATINIINAGELDLQNPTADLVQFPKDFDATQYYLRSLERERHDAIQKGYGDVWTTDALGGGGIPDQQEALRVSVIDNQLAVARDRIKKGDKEFIEEASLKGANVFVQDYIKQAVESEDPRYAEMGQGWVEGGFTTVIGGLQRSGLNVGAAFLSLGQSFAKANQQFSEAVTPQVLEQYNKMGLSPETTDKLYGYTLGLQEGMSDAENAINNARGGLSKKAEEISKRQGFSLPEINNPQLTEFAEGATQAITSASEFAVASAFGGPIGTSIYAYLQGAGSKSIELAALERERLQNGDVEGARFVRENQGWISALSGGTTTLVERISMGEVALGSRGTLGALRRQAGATAGRDLWRRLKVAGSEGVSEGFEGVVDSLAQSIQSYYTGVIDSEELSNRIADLDDDFIFEMVGAAVPVSIRTARGAVSDQVSRDVKKQTAQRILEEVDRVSESQGISKEEAAEVVGQDSVQAAVNRANEWLKKQQGQPGDKPKPKQRTPRGVVVEEEIPASQKPAQQDITSSNQPTRDADSELFIDPSSTESGLTDLGGAEGNVMSLTSLPTDSEVDLVYDESFSVDSGLTDPGDVEGDVMDLIPQRQRDNYESNVEQPFQSTETTEEEVPPSPEDVLRIKNYLRTLTNSEGTGSFDAQLREVMERHGVSIDEIATFIARNTRRVDKKTGKVYRVITGGDRTDPNPDANLVGLPGVISDKFGKTKLVSHLELIDGIKAGEIDPQNDFFYISVSLRPSPFFKGVEGISGYDEDAAKFYSHDIADYKEALSLIPSSQLIQYDPSDLTVAEERETTEGETGVALISSKAYEQYVLRDSPYGIETATLGGSAQNAEVNPAYGVLPDLLVQAGIPIPTDSDRNLTQSEIDTLGKLLNSGFGLNGWRIKPDYGGQSSDHRTSIFGLHTHGLTVGPNSVWVVQPTVSFDREFRIDVRVNEESNPNDSQLTEPEQGGDSRRQSIVNIVPLASSDKTPGSKNLLPYTTKKIRDQLKEVFQTMKDAGATTPNTSYGLDVGIKEDGSIVVFEMNPTETFGGSGWVEFAPERNRQIASAVGGRNSVEQIAALAALVRARGNAALADKLIDDALQGKDIPDDIQEQEYQKRVLFSNPGSPSETGYKFNGSQKGLDGVPIFDLYTIQDVTHPFDGSTISVPYGATDEDVKIAIQKKRETAPPSRLSRKPGEAVGRSKGKRARINAAQVRYTFDDFMKELNASPDGSVYHTIETALQTMAKSKNNAIAKLAGNLLGVLQEHPDLVKDVLIYRNRDTDRSLFQPGTRTEPGHIELGTSASEEALMEEVIHAFAENITPYTLSKIMLPGMTGEQYLQVLEDYLKNGDNDMLKPVIRNYIAVVKALGLENEIFGKKKRTPEDFTNNHILYGLSDLLEFIPNAINTPQLKDAIRKIKNPYQEGLFRRLLRSIIDFIKGFISPSVEAGAFFDKVYADTMAFLRTGEVARTEYDRSLLSVYPLNLRYTLTNAIAESDSIALQDKLSPEEKKTLSQLNHQKAKASKDFKATTVFARRLDMSQMRSGARIRTLDSDAAIDLTQDVDVTQMIPGDGPILVWNDQERGGGFVSVIDDGSLTREDRETLSDRGIDIFNVQNYSIGDLARKSNNSGKNANPKMPKQPPTRTVGDFTFNNEHLTPQDKRSLTLLEKRMAKGTVASDDALKTLRDIKGKSDVRELLSMKEQYPDAFDNVSINNITDARLRMIDYLLDNPADPSQSTETNGLTRVERMVELRDQLDRLKAKPKTEFLKIPDQKVKDWINRSIDFMSNNFNPEQITNRQLKAFAEILRMFNDSDGANISGFAKVAAELARQDNLKKLNNAKTKISFGIRNRSRIPSGNSGENAYGSSPAFNVFGMPISNLRRGKVGESKIALSDVTTELDAIFNREPAKDAIIDVISGYHAGLNDFNVMENDLLDRYRDRIKAIEDRWRQRGRSNPTLLDESIIQIAKRVTQFDPGSTTSPIQQMINNISDEMASIDRKGRATSTPRVMEEGQIDQEAYNILNLQDVFLIASQGGFVDATEMINEIERNLDGYHQEILKTLREPGIQYWNGLNAVNQLAIGTAASPRRQLRQWTNYAKRSGRALNAESFSSLYAEPGFTAALSILQPRTRLARDHVFNSSWRSDLDRQLTETAYELTTGVERVHLFNTFNGPQIVQVLDDGAADAPRTNRMQSQLGNLHINTRNPEMRLSDMAQALVQTSAWMMASKLISGNQIANQLAPMAIYAMFHPVTVVEAAVSRTSFTDSKRIQDQFMQRYSPFLYNRMRHYEQLVEKGRDRIERRSMQTGLDALDTTWRDVRRHLNRGAFWTSEAVSFLASLPIMITNGITEVFSARNVFMSIYAEALVRRGLASDISSVLSGRTIPFNQQALTEAELEMERYVLAPLNPAYRGEMWQRNSVGKELLRQSAYSLARTGIQQSLKAGTAARDLTHAVREASITGSPASRDFVRQKAKDLLIQNLQLAVYYGIRLSTSKMGWSLAGVASFVAAAALQGEKEDEEEWVRRLRVLGRAFEDRESTYMSQQMITDYIYQIMPIGHLQNNVGRSMLQNFLRMGWLSQFDPEQLDKDAKDLEDTRNAIKKKQAAHTKLGEHDKAIKLDIPLEYVETALEKTREMRNARRQMITRAAEDTFADILPVRREVVDNLRDLQDVLIPKGDQEYQEQLEKSKTSNAYWAISSWLSLASGPRRAADKTIREKAWRDYKARENTEDKRDAAQDRLDGIPIETDIDVPEDFKQSVPERTFPISE